MNKIRLCASGKIAYLDVGLAKAEIRRANEIPDQYHGKGCAPTAYYRCKLCGFYHVTSRPGGNARSPQIPGRRRRP